jgi:hypothetical protein
MIKLLFVCIFLISQPLFAYNKLIPGKNYSVRYFQIYRELIKNAKEKDETKLKGAGFEFTGSVTIEENKETKLKKYFTFIRNCGKVELPSLDEKEMKKVHNGTAITLLFKESRTCIVSDWKVN